MTKQGNWIRQQTAMKETKEKERTRNEAIGKLFHDFAKLSYAGLVIGGITPFYTDTYNDSNWGFVSIGMAVSVIFSLIGNYIFKR